MQLKEISLFSKSPNNANSPMQFGFPWRKMTSDGTRQIGCHGKKTKKLGTTMWAWALMLLDNSVTV
jgi:hypothetical protein